MAASRDELALIDAYWRAANYLSVGQIYLLDNPLLREPLQPEHVKPRLLGHWGTTPGLNFIYAHLNRVIRSARPRRDLRHRARATAGPRLVANAYLEGTYSEVYPTSAATRTACAGCSGSSPSPAASRATSRPRRPARSTRAASSATRSSHAFGAAFDNPDLLVACVVGDGEAETGPLATSWHSNKFLDPARDGAVLPILHLNGYKIANPTVLARIPDRRADVAAARATATTVTSSRATSRRPMHQRMASALDDGARRDRGDPARGPRRAEARSGRAGR